MNQELIEKMQIQCKKMQIRNAYRHRQLADKYFIHNSGALNSP